MCLGSLVRHSREPVRFLIHEDGSLTDEDREQLSSQLPVYGFISKKQADVFVKEQLSNYPYCAQFRRRYVYGMKLFDAPLLADGDDFVFCDTDIFFLRPFTNLFAWPDNRTGCLFMQDYQNAYSFRPWHLAFQRRFQMPPKLNCGLFQFRRRHHDLDFLEWFLERYQRLFTARHHWVEQTCWGALAMSCNGQFWSEEQIRVIQGEACLTGDLVGAHFVTPVRGLLPEAAARSRPEAEPVLVRTEPMRRLSALALWNEQSRQTLHRKFGRAL